MHAAHLSESSASNLVRKNEICQRAPFNFPQGIVWIPLVLSGSLVTEVLPGAFRCHVLSQHSNARESRRRKGARCQKYSHSILLASVLSNFDTEDDS
jgi:hypothetical protein